MLSVGQIMTRSILTFETVFQVLAAQKLLNGKIKCRTVPTPSGLSTSICGISLELLEPDRSSEANQLLCAQSLTPRGIHELE